jgi:hypothetical protein
MKLRSKDLKPGMVVRPYNTPRCGYWGEVVEVKRPQYASRYWTPWNNGNPQRHRGGSAPRGAFWTVYVQYNSGERMAHRMHTNRWWEVQDDTADPQ